MLKASEFVTKVNLTRQQPATFTEICSWEVDNDFILPQDMRNFYQSTNGFCFTYNFRRGKTDQEEFTSGSIKINSLCKLTQIQSFENSKIFALASLDEDNLVVLAQLNLNMSPNIWLYFKMKVYYFLSENFTTYFRMSVAHLGVPGWQLMLLKAYAPEWGVEMLQILAPRLSEERHDEDNNHLNILDCSIFEHEEASKTC